MEESRESNYAGVFDTRLGFGDRPAIVSVDFVLAYTTPGSPLFAEGVVRAVTASVDLLATARARGLPIVHTRVVYHPSGRDGGVFVRKVPTLRRLVQGEPLADIDPRVAPSDGETVVVKQYPSCFFGTPLAAMLTAKRIDTVVLIGCSTSGCIRASAVDGMQHGFRVIVPRECVGDRHEAPHEANLFDIDCKYGDVLPMVEVVRYLESRG